MHEAAVAQSGTLPATNSFSAALSILTLNDHSSECGVLGAVCCLPKGTLLLEVSGGIAGFRGLDLYNLSLDTLPSNHVGAQSSDGIGLAVSTDVSLHLVALVFQFLGNPSDLRVVLGL